MAKRYRITCSTDAYHASRHANWKGREILKYDGATPVKWVHDDNFGLGYTLKDVRQALMSFAYEDSEKNGQPIEHKYFQLWYRDDVWMWEAEEF